MNAIQNKPNQTQFPRPSTARQSTLVGRLVRPHLNRLIAPIGDYVLPPTVRLLPLRFCLRGPSESSQDNRGHSRYDSHRELGYHVPFRSLCEIILNVAPRPHRLGEGTLHTPIRRCCRSGG